ncbi:hypothetical protein TWF569_007908 [Orbilia oligospora]|uniref:Pre-rRNA-processing protein RIX1 n=1 Tax=Orbilia oligospora TaxID=2813651 RepID=A0A7C8NCD9_ORBOL|nr:hypothetical protein TWF102_000390 [Orbilia oligospora]KAF3115901.1 hypothetical protein TWF103_010136 [Orbilia oligospora]KAF3149599.1 hypothetical protein TWF594_010705 [Orbilia oligospora]KAF3155862.1 hypothetical protein TWF569_007908 [Orbilia oligospora]
MLPPDRIVALLSTVASTIAPSKEEDESRLHNNVAVCLDIIYSTTLLEDANAQVAAGGRYSAEITSFLHKIKTRISSLLQSRTPQARWAGVCLVKAGIETSSTFLQGVGLWIPMLLKMVNKPQDGGPIAERAIATLTRLFVLTTSKPTLTRELTSPHLPTFSQYLLSISAASASSDTLLVVLQSIAQILKTHPTTFRPQQTKTHQLVRSILFSEDDRVHSDEIVQAATAVYVSLIKCAQPKTQAEEWVKLFKETISTTEQTCDVLFDSINEEKDLDKNSHRPRAETQVRHLLSPERIGIKRTCILLGVLQRLLSHPTNFNPAPSIPLSPLVSLLDRIFAVHPGIKPHPSAPPSTYHLLLASYPTVLLSAIPLITTLVTRASHYSPSLPLQFLHPLTFTFTTSSKHHTPLKGLVYTTLSQILSLTGRTLSPKDVQPLLEIFSSACEDIVPPPPPVIITKEPVSTPNSMLLTQPTSTYKKRKAPAPQNKANTPAASSMHADQFLKPSFSSSSSSIVEETPLILSAKTLLTTVLLTLPSPCIPSEIRSKLERTMVLSFHTPGLLAAVLYPSTKKRGGSLLPHLIASHTNDLTQASVGGNPIDEEHTLLNMAIEATLYPRMQVVKPVSQPGNTSDGNSVLGSPIEGRFWGSAVSPSQNVNVLQPTTASIDEIVSPPTGEVDMTISNSNPNDDAPSEEESYYPPPPPAPVPQHATLPASSPNKQSQAPMSPPSIPPRPNNSTNGTSSDNNSNTNGGGRNYIPVPSPGRGVHAALPPSPLRQSMSIFEAAEMEEGKERGSKRVKLGDDGRSPLSFVEAVGGNAESDDEEDIPEIVMGESDDE